MSEGPPQQGRIDGRRRRSPALLFALAWGTAGLVATLTGAAESLVAATLDAGVAEETAPALHLLNVAGWWTLSGAFRGLMTVLVLRLLAASRGDVPALRLVAAFATIWLIAGLLHQLFESSVSPDWSQVLLAPMALIGGVMTWAMHTITPGVESRLRARTFAIWTLGFVLFLFAVELSEIVWERAGLPTEGAAAFVVVLGTSVAMWALFGAVGGTACSGWGDDERLARPSL